MDSRIPDFLFAQFGIAGLIGIGILTVLFKLGADFAKLRTDFQQQVMHDLLNKRVLAYDTLWSKTRSLALYDRDVLSEQNAQQVSASLSDWYFGCEGGLFLTARNREFYFALQDVLQVAGHLPAWRCTDRPNETGEMFERFLSDILTERNVHNFRIAQLKHPESLPADVWRDICKLAAARLKAYPSNNDPAFGAVVFAVLQQVASVLRSNLADGLHTRLEIHAPKP